MANGTLEARVHRVARAARATDAYPSEAVEYAAAMTLRAARRDGAGLWPSRRIESYFASVARRRAIRRHAGSTAALRAVADSVVADLLSSGRSELEVYEELDRGWRHALTSDVLEEYRARLCA